MEQQSSPMKNVFTFKLSTRERAPHMNTTVVTTHTKYKFQSAMNRLTKIM